MRKKIKWVFLYPIRSVQQIFKFFFENEIYVLGDSHCDVFNYLNRENNLNTKFKVNMVPGATALGLVNPNSATNALNIFRESLKSIKKRKKLIFLLGEVDTNFLIWYRHEKYLIPIKEETDRSLNNYIDFLKECISIGFKKIYVLSVPLPTIFDEQNWGEIANKRKEVKATQRERTDLTLKYNESLEEKVKVLKVSYISLDKILYNTKTGIIKNEFLNKNPLNHHLENSKYAVVLKQAMKAMKII